MEKTMTSLLLLVLLCPLGALSQISVTGKVFVFPRTSADSYVLLKPTLVQPLQCFTMCLSFFSDLTRPFSLFSAASTQHDNEILLMRYPAEYYIWVGSEHLTFSLTGNTARSSSHWERASLTWNSATGIIQLWVDGQPLPRKGVAKGYSIPTDLVMILGQDQDSFGGSLDAQQSFVGEMTEVYLWDTVLPPDQLRKITRDTAPTPLVNWTALNFQIKGYVVMEPMYNVA